MLLTGIPNTAACADAQAADPFEEVVLPRRTGSGHFWAYSSMIGGVGFVGLSFVLKDRADVRYEEYLASTDPAEIDRLYDETVSLDRWSTTSLIAGQALIVLGLYLRFVHPSRSGAQAERVPADTPPPAQFGLDLAPHRVALSVRF